MKKYFVTATGTDIGKTFFICKFIKQILAKNKTVKAIKPIITGLSYDDPFCDSTKILSALGERVSPANINSISPFSYQEPVSPDIAAQREKKPYLNYQKVLSFCNNFLNENNRDYGLIEGVGGINVPINQEKTILDLLIDLKKIKIIIISDNYLGTINHTLNTLYLCQEKNLDIEKIYLNNICNNKKTFLENFYTIKSFVKGSIKVEMLD